MTPTPTGRAGWIPELSGYRALAAIAVFGFHLASVDPPGGWLGRLTIPLGNAAVSLFFVLSGFLIYRPFAQWALLDRAPVSTWRFIIRRLARILPLYWVVLTVHFLVTDAGQPLSLGDYLTSFFLVQNFRGSLVFLPPFVAWSLSIELWFSVALPLLAAPLRRAGRGRRLVERLHVQLLGIAFLGGAAIVFRIWAVGAPGTGRQLWMPAYLDWFAAGLALAVLRTYWSVRPPGVDVRQLAARPIYLSSLGLTSYWSVTQLGLPGGFVTPTSFQTHAQFLLQGLMSFLLVAAVVLPGADFGLARRFFASRLLQWLGAISYGIYLIHPVITDELIENFPDTQLGLLAPYAIALTLALSALLHELIEKPASRLVDHWVVPETEDPASPPTVERSETHRVARGETTPVRVRDAGASRPKEVLGRPRFQALLLAALAFISPILSLPNRYVSDSRFELLFAPGARLDRMFVGWDSGRGLGRPAEEFWPFLTFAATALQRIGVEPWLTQRIIHGSLLTTAAVGMLVLARALDRHRPLAAPLAAVLYAFGPASAIYLLPVPLYTSYAIAPWLAVAVLRAARGRPLRWSGVAAGLFFLAGNADPPGLILATIPAATLAIGFLARRRDTRKPLIAFALVTAVLTGLSSAAMLVKTLIGSAALAHRLVETETIEAVASASSFGESIRGGGFWLLYFRLTPTAFRDHLSGFVDNGWVILAMVVPIAVGIAGLGRRPSGHRLLALCWVIVGIVVMVGPHPVENPTPWGRVLLDAFDANGPAFAFRSSHKAGVILAMGTALLAAWAANDLAVRLGRLGPRVRRAAMSGAAALGLAVVATITTPFWTTPLYDSGLSTAGIPDYWEAAASALDAESPGRVLVLPGSTNNGYRWGTVGDDLIDAFVPNPVVSTTLPLSTPQAADAIDALNAVLTAADYVPGSLAPIAQRLGITHLLIRNDLTWETQGLARPQQLDALRHDPSLTLVSSHGPPGYFVLNPLDPNESEADLAPVEIYRIDGATRPEPTILPSTGLPRTILVDGNGEAFVRLAAEGLLDGGHIVVPAPQVENLGEVDGDVALVVVTGTTRPLDRRIEYYGYRFAPAIDPATANDWLGLAGPGDLTTVGFDGLTIDSSVDRWLLDADAQPTAALDNDPTTAWRVPRLAQIGVSQLRIRFSERQDLGGTVIVVDDSEQRIGEFRVLADGAPVEVDRSGEHPIIGDVRASALTIEIGGIRPGLAPIGVTDIELPPSASASSVLATRYPDRLAEVASSLTNAESVPALFLLGPEQPTSRPVVSDIVTWHDRPHRLTVTLESDATSSRCLPIASIDGAALPMLIQPTGDGRAIATPCETSDDLVLAPGPHRIAVQAPTGDLVTDVRLHSGAIDLAPITRRPLLAETDRVAVGDIVVLSASIDPGWSLDGHSDEPFAADGLAAFRISEAGPVGVIQHSSDRLVRQSWWVSMVGLALCAIVTVMPSRQFTTSRAGIDRSDTGAPVPRHRRLASVGSAVIGAGAAWLFVGPLGLLAAGVAWVIARRNPATVFVALGLAVLVVTAARVFPLVASDRAIIDPTSANGAMQFVIGALVMAASMALARVSNVAGSASTHEQISDELPR